MRNFPLPLLALFLLVGVAARFELAEVSLISPADDSETVPVAPTFRWSPVDGAEGYELQVATKRNMRQPTIDLDDVKGTIVTLPTQLNQSDTYFWRVRAFDAQGAQGPWSRVWSFQTGQLPGQPVLTYPQHQSVDVALSPEFAWTEANRADAYNVEISTAPDFSSTFYSATQIDATSLTIPVELNTQTRYYWRVQASSAVGDGEYSGVAWFETLASSPSQVSLLSPSDGAADVEPATTFAWEAAPGAESYRLEVAQTTDFDAPLMDIGGITTTSYAVSAPFLNGDLLYWRVRATNGLGDGPLSAIRSFTTAVGGATQAVLVSPPDGADDVELTPTLSWQTVDGADTYRVQVAQQPDFSASLLHDTVVESSQFITSRLSLGQTYYWRVRASNAGEQNWSAVSNFSTGAGAPARIALVSPANGAQELELEPELTWAASDLAATYNLEIGLDADFNTILLSESGLTESAFTPEKMDGSTEYYWRVQGVNAAGTGPWSETRSFTTRAVFAPAAPILIYPPNGAEGVASNPVLSWNAVDGAASYKLELSTSPPDNLENFVTVVTAVVVSQPFFQSPDLSIGQTHYWRVEARNDGGSTRSEVWTFKTAAVTDTESDEVPTDFGLDQNYPNPFNPSTTISYSLADRDFVDLSIVDVTGRTVAVLVSGEQSPGRYDVRWNGRAQDGSPAPSGVYLYRLATSNDSTVRRMVLAK